MTTPYTATEVKATTPWLKYALEYHAMGLGVLPIRAGTKECPVPWKRCQTVPPSLAELREWFDRADIGGLAVLAGAVSGGGNGNILVCRDHDNPDGYQRFAAGNPGLAATLPTVRTHRGYHVLVRCKADPRIVHDDGGEIRGAGYSLLPPSLHPSGTRYAWEISPVNGIPTVDDATYNAIFGTHVTHDTQATQEYTGKQNEQKKQRTLASETSSDVLSLDMAIALNIPQGPGERHHCIFQFVRCLKAMPDLRDAEPPVLRDIFREWHRQALPYIGTPEWDESWSDFVSAWGNVKYAAGEGPIAGILERIARTPPPPECENYDTPQVRTLICVCRELQRQYPSETFYLSCRTAGELVGIDHVRAARYLKMLVADGVLVLVQRGDERDRSASRYRYTGDIR